MKHIFKRSILSAILLLIAIRVIAQQSKPARLDSIFTALYNSGQFSGNVLIAENGQILFQKTYGLADIEKNVPNDFQTRFLLGSVSKQFTAAAIVLLKEAGKLQYDDLVTKYLPGLPYTGITIRQVLNHTSGLPDYDALMQHKWDISKFATNDDMLKMLVQYNPDPFFPPGQKYLYSNTGYAILALVIEKVSNTSYPDFMKNKLFSPLGMSNTLIYTRRARPMQVADAAIGYVYNDSLKTFVLPEQHPMWKNALWEDGVYGEDGVNSTVGDMLKWDQVVYTHALLTTDDWQQILAPGKVVEGTNDYGFGWHIINPNANGRIAYHSGGWPGFIAYNEQGLDKNYSIIILRNKFTTHIRMPVDAIRSILDSGK